MTDLVKTAFNHPITPILLGAVLTFEGTGHIRLKSWGLLLCGLWLCYDLGRVIWQKPWINQRKAITFSVVFFVTFALVMACMYWLLQGEVSAEQQEVYQMLTITANMPTDGDVLKSTFTVANLGRTDIGKHRIYCIPRLVIFGNNRAIIGPEARLSVRDGLSIQAGHDAETEPCAINTLNFNAPLACEDLIVGITYELDAEAGITRDKQFRFVFNRNEPAWHQQPVKYSGSYCDNDKIRTAPH